MAPHHGVDGSAANTYFFGNENFQRDKKELLSQMKSVTAAKTRTEQAQEIGKRDMSVSDAALGPVPSNIAVQQQQQQQQQSALPQSLVAPNPLQAYLATLGAGGPSNQAALLQAMNLANLQYQIAAAQSGAQVLPPADASQLLRSLVGFSGALPPFQLPRAPNVNPQLLPHLPSPVTATTGSLLLQAAPMPTPLPPPLQLPQPFPQQPPGAAQVPPPQPAAPAIPQHAIPPGLASNPADQARLREAIQMFLDNRSTGDGPPGASQLPPSDS